MSPAVYSVPSGGEVMVATGAVFGVTVRVALVLVIVPQELDTIQWNCAPSSADDTDERV